MTERVLIYTQFAGVTLDNGTTIRQIAPYELSGNMAATNIFYLSNFVKYDVDGAGDGTRIPGNIRAVFRVTGATHAAAQALSLTLQGLLNKRSTLVGAEYSASSAGSVSCSARCMVARPMARIGLAMAAGKTYQIEVEMVWEKFSTWT